MRWTVFFLNATVAAEVEALPDDMRARLARFIEIIKETGLQALPRDSVKHLEDKLWELRVTGRDGISRAIYMTASGAACGDPARLRQENAEDATA